MHIIFVYKIQEVEGIAENNFAHPSDFLWLISRSPFQCFLQHLPGLVDMPIPGNQVSP